MTNTFLGLFQWLGPVKTDSDDKRMDSFSDNPMDSDDTRMVTSFSDTSPLPDTTFESSATNNRRDAMIRRASMETSIFAQEVNKLTEEKKTCCERNCRPSQSQTFYLFSFFLPTIICLLYAGAIFFPPGFRKHAPFLLWTDGELTKSQEGYPMLCPRASTCAEGAYQILLVAMARLTAFASYVVMGLTFFSKMHSLIHYLSTTYISTMIPLQSLHEVHTHSGKMFGSLALLHTITHYLRYIVRRDLDQISSQVHISGLVAILAMAFVVLIMTKISRTRFAFEKRFNIHWMFLLIVLALLFHNPRTRIIVLTFFGLWALDYTYELLNRTHELEVVEFTYIGDGAGIQMLWRNPEGFNVKSGEYVLVKLPWLKEGSKEWHPFSIYLREATKEGLEEVHRISNSGRRVENSIESLSDYVQAFVTDKFVLEHSPEKNAINLSKEARQELTSYDTTQVFINPVGNWTKGLLEQVKDRKQLQSCWVKGPYTSPYFVASHYSHFVMVATGIGITPALGVIGQYPGFSRTKILVWSLKDKDLLQFFAPLLKDAHLSVIFYTGKDKFTENELRQIKRSYGNIFVQQSRTHSLTDTIDNIITQFENSISSIHGNEAANLRAIHASNKKSWCVLCCSGSKDIRKTLETFAEDNGLGWECESFDW